MDSLLAEATDSETDVRDSDDDLPEAPHVIEMGRANAEVLVEMKGFPTEPLGLNLSLKDGLF